MDGRLFALVDEEVQEHVIGWGIEITDPDDREAVVFFRDPQTGRRSYGVHDSAEAALRCWTRVGPMALVWHS